MELLDYTDKIGAILHISGYYKPSNKVIDFVISKDGINGSIGSVTCSGRSNSLNVDEALTNLTNMISEKTVWFGSSFFNVPKLVHTAGYRGTIELLDFIKRESYCIEIEGQICEGERITCSIITQGNLCEFMGVGDSVESSLANLAENINKAGIFPLLRHTNGYRPRNR